LSYLTINILILTLWKKKIKDPSDALLAFPTLHSVIPIIVCVL